MSSKRKSAFSVYKMQQQQAAKIDESVQLSESSGSEMEKIETNGERKQGSNSSISTKEKHGKIETLNKSNKEQEKQDSKSFSRASKLRHSIGNLGLNKKRRKMKKTESGSTDEIELEKNIKKARVTLNSSNENIKPNNEAETPAVVQDAEPVLKKEEKVVFPKKKFEWLISPVKTDKFFSGLWENKPLLVKRHESDYYHGIFSTSEMDKILRENNVKFSVNLDVTSYKNGQRETHNLSGRALAPVVWDFYKNGCSVRLLNPQTFSESIWKLSSTLQEYFGSFVGANVYLTPPNTQGFAPHYDDIEAFILQLEGKKHWRLYNPRKDDETLPRYSSSKLNFISVNVNYWLSFWTNIYQALTLSF